MLRAVAGRRWLAAALPMLLCAPLAPAAVCPLEVVGTWKLSDAAQVGSPLISFTRDGWANVLSGSAAGTPGDILAQVRYQLQPTRDPRRIEFQARRGNDVFPAGMSSWEITAHGDESFTARRTDAVDGAQSLWSRVQTHRYFLTFAARKDSTGRAAVAFVMWTTLDGRRMELDALGRVLQGGEARFGRIPHEIAREFARQGDPARDVMMRMELNEAEYRRTREVYRSQQRLSNQAPAPNDPDSQTLQLIDATLQSLNQCGARIRTADALAVAAVPTAALPRRPLELVRTLRKANDRQHVPDKAFPFVWKPAELT
jgi:hypothetical protein